MYATVTSVKRYHYLRLYLVMIEFASVVTFFILRRFFS